MLKFKSVLVIGGGLMGSGISQVCASNGYKVILIDQNEKIIMKSKEGIKSSLKKMALKKFNDEERANNNVSSLLSNITFCDNFKKYASSSNLLIIEAIVENLSLKQKLFSDLDEYTLEDTVYTSNTSSLPITDIAKVTKRPSQFAGFHFFNPVPIMKLVEIISTDKTKPTVISSLKEFVISLSKQPVFCKDTPGFIVNRLLIPYLMQALQMYERGDATKEDIDVAMKLGAGYPMGPFELLDFIGLDTTAFILDGWRKSYPDNPLFAKSTVLEELVKKKKFGRKSGSGFYEYK